MIQKHSSKLTVFQLFFLSFSYVFSGLFLIGERSFLSLLIPIGTVLLFSLWGYFLTEMMPRGGAEKERFSFSRFFGMPKLLSVPLSVVFVLLAVAEAALSLIAFCFSVRSFSAFIPFWLVFIILGALVLFVAFHGLTAIGRLAELLAFLILPLIFYLVFWDVSPIELTSFSSDLYVLFTVSPAPILYLFFVTVLQSTSMPDVKSLRLLPLTCVLGASLAVLCAILFLLYGASEKNVFLLFFGWMTSVIRIGMLLCVKI